MLTADALRSNAAGSVGARQANTDGASLYLYAPAIGAAVSSGKRSDCWIVSGSQFTVTHLLLPSGLFVDAVTFDSNDAALVLDAGPACHFTAPPELSKSG